MATYRIGIGSFNLKDNAVGIGTESSGLGNLKVEGTYKVTDLDVTGVSTFTRYAGFAADNLNINKDKTLTGEHQTTGDIVVGVNSTFTVSTGATVCTGTVESISLTDHFSPPTGGIEDRPEVPVEGTVRFNRDLNTLEFYNGFEWRQFTVSGASGRAVLSAGNDDDTTYVKKAEYFNINTLGNSQFFGEVNVARRGVKSCSSEIRGLTAGGYDGGFSNVIDYFAIASAGNFQDFGDLTSSQFQVGSFSSSTRGVFGGGEPFTNVISYVEISTIGDALDFGDLSVSRNYVATHSSPVRGVFAGGLSGWGTPAGWEETIEHVTISSKGNGTQFGNLTAFRHAIGSCSNSIRGLFFGGSRSPLRVTIMDYIPISTGGNSVEFGNLSSTRSDTEAVATSTRAVCCGGYSSSNVNIMEYVTISTLGDAIDFGDLIKPIHQQGACSDSHGGLGGY